MTVPLHIVRFVLDRRELTRLARRHRLRYSVDEGYLLHAGLAELFATSKESAQIPLHTFAIDETLPKARRQPDAVFLLAYSDLNEETLKSSMRQSQLGLVRECKAKDVPAFPEGSKAGFRVRVCPIVRTRRPAAAGAGTDAGSRGKPRELDAWLASAVFERTVDVPAVREALPFERSATEWEGREEVYGKWLARELQRNGAAEPEVSPRLTGFKRDKLYRRGAQAASVLQRPNAVMEGVLRVADRDAFQALLRRGIGRHRAFGFGMLLLRPVKNGPC